MGALVFKECWAHRVLGGSKTWEIRQGLRHPERHQAPAALYERYKQPHAYALASPVRRSAPLRITRRKGQVTWVLV